MTRDYVTRVHGENARGGRTPAGRTAAATPRPAPRSRPSGKKLGFTIDNGKLHNVSLGQGQEVVAEDALDVAAEKGHWVILQVWSRLGARHPHGGPGACEAAGRGGHGHRQVGGAHTELSSARASGRREATGGSGGTVD